MGLHLYAGGSVAPLVRGTLQLTDPESPLYEAPEAKKDAAEPTASVSRLQAATNVRDDAR
jgi:hypothetical protein